jgi:hypothetical protein
VVLDLNGDGVHFLPTDAGVHYDYGNGSVGTAWASPEDGILVRDANHNGAVDNASEFVFGHDGVTDLQALAGFDSNHDGQLSSADADFGSFAVWQDGNSNGQVDPGELSSLTARGIASVSLSTDGVSYTAANGEVDVVGTGSFARTDGSIGSLADAIFQTGSRDSSESLRSSSALGTNAALIAALAAAGLEAQDRAVAGHAFAHEAGSSQDSAPLHTAAFAPIAEEAGASIASSHLAQPEMQSHAMDATPRGGSHFHDMVQQMQGVSHGEGRELSGATELLHGSEVPAHGGAQHATAVTAAGIAMPSAAQLAAAAGAHADGAKAAAADGAQHNAVVGKVLADSLHGGEGHGPNIDALLAAHTGHSGAPDLIEALASHGAGGVPYGHSGGSSAIAMAHSMFSMAMMHHDAAPPAHG